MKNSISTIPRATIFTIGATMVVLAGSANVRAQVGDISGVTYPNWIPFDRVLPAINTVVTYDDVAHVWRYSYSVGNGAAAEQPIQSLGLRFNGPASQVTMPADWWGIVFVDNPSAIPGATFHAEGSDNFVSTPNGEAAAQPAAAISPGAALAGFNIVSLYPPGDARTYVQGYAPVPYLPNDFDQDTNLPDDTTNAQRGSSLGPTRYTVVANDGNRRPAVDGFLAFMNVQTSGSVLHNPAVLALKFAINGETVFQQTFHATLNGVDVTAQFHPGPSDGADLTAVFAIGSSPLAAGKNILITTVDGIVPGTTRGATDTDRIVFTVAP
jgi:hypothetical protein